MANKVYTQMYGEFQIAQNLKHKNIVNYLYFVRQYSEETQTYEIHNIIEKLNGRDMRCFIKEHKKAFNIS